MALILFIPGIRLVSVPIAVGRLVFHTTDVASAACGTLKTRAVAPASVLLVFPRPCLCVLSGRVGVGAVAPEAYVSLESLFKE